jgi:cell division protein ZapE
MTPNTLYQKKLDSNLVQADIQQAAVIEKLTQLHQQITQPRKKFWFQSRQQAKGLYIWGTVGIGKTFMMDLFCETANFPILRQHFFDFMQSIHQQLNELQGQKNPLDKIAKRLAARVRVICFDEFFVSDIADAMLLGTLFQRLFDHGTTLVATSNVPPDELYKNGLQRERFLPAIEAIKTHTTVMHLQNTHDYRYRDQRLTHRFVHPLDTAAQQHMQNAFQYYGHNQPPKAGTIMINHRPFAYLGRSQSVLWCNFEALCQEDRSQQDYSHIAQHFHTLLLDQVIPMTAQDRKTVLRFIHLIDILYDHRIRLIMASATPAESLYPKGPYAFEFKRTLSRLNEMQTPAYQPLT